jgi:hypothetical protein
VYDVVLPRRAVMRFHEHPTNHLAVVVDSGRMANELLGRPAKVNPTGPAGTIVYLPAGPPHRQTNIGETIVRFVAVEVLSGSAPGATEVEAGGDRRSAPDSAAGCRIALEASDIRAWRCNLAPGQRVPDRPGMGAYLRVELSGPRRGAVAWHDGGADSTDTREIAALQFVDLEWK